MNDKYPSCEERIDERLETALDDLRRGLGRLNEWLGYCNDCGYGSELDWTFEEEPDGEDTRCPKCGSDDLWLREDDGERRQSYEEGVLEVTKLHTVYRVGLSWGGPADGFYLYFDEENELVKAEYYFQDWFDGAKRVLYGEALGLVEDMFHGWCVDS